MIRSPERVEELERQFARQRLSRMTYQHALAIFIALWDEACALDPEFPGDWRADMGPDLAIARALNGLAPGS